MRVLYALVAEDAHLRHDGRLDVHGIHHELHAAGYPAMQERLTFAVALEWDEAERGTIDVTIDLLDPDRSPVMTISGQTEVDDSAARHRPARSVLVVPLLDVPFPRPGTYWFELKVGGHGERVAPLHLYVAGVADAPGA
jgi:hypothetical protein